MLRILRRLVSTAARPAPSPPRARQDCGVCGEQGGHGWTECPAIVAGRADDAWIRECLRANHGIYFPGDAPGAPRSG